MSYGKGITYRKNLRKNIVLFDMDGTLTEARRPIGIVMVKVLRELISQDELAHQRPSVEIGVVTGSDLVYVKEQMKPLFEKDYDLAKRIHWLPCNGTKYYKFDGDWEILHSVDMRASLGAEGFRDVMKELCVQQEHISSNRIPLTGHFINYRGSMINWCPIGRNANEKDREEFEKIDKDFKSGGLRRNYLLRLKRNPIFSKVMCKLGGDTSFDIYPIGWDKTYCLKYFEEYNKYFIGDRCHPDGNDYEIFKSLNPCSWETKHPQQTMELINENIYPLIS